MFYESTTKVVGLQRCTRTCTFEGMNIFTPEVRKCFRTRTVHNYTYTYSTHLSESMIHPTCTVRRYNVVQQRRATKCCVCHTSGSTVSISGNRIRVLPEVHVLSKVLPKVLQYCTYFRNVVCSCVRRYESTFEGNRILP
jgi:hypothetical protein